MKYPKKLGRKPAYTVPVFARTSAKTREYIMARKGKLTTGQLIDLAMKEMEEREGDPLS